ncbi:6 protein [Cytorhabdovirus hordei]|uniref:6 protein n=1 Tax=Cytorhabdovirus hordei TaxID=1985699 RepID=A0A0C5L1Z0_9RHAB|nr:6 protein [Cytorhabdovirus hordei]AJP67520.1 6 protein [Cytorhabdovirus hordei]
MASRLLNSLEGKARDITITSEDGVEIQWKNADLHVEWNMRAHNAKVEHLGGKEIKLVLEPSKGKGPKINMKLGESTMVLMEGGLTLTLLMTVTGNMQGII